MKVRLTVLAVAVGVGCGVAPHPVASADPGGWVGPFSSSWTCGQRESAMGLTTDSCQYRTGDSRGDGYYFYYRP